MARIGFLGPQGSYSEEAALGYAAAVDELVPLETMEAVLLALVTGAVELGVLPVRNGATGVVAEAEMALQRYARDGLTQVAVLDLEVHHHLVGPPGTSLAGIERVLSHPQALAQCRQFLAQCLPGAERVPVSSTAAAVRALGEAGVAAIASRRAAQRYDMELLASGIEDQPDNVTQFSVMACRGHRGTRVVAPVVSDPAHRGRAADS